MKARRQTRIARWIGISEDDVKFGVRQQPDALFANALGDRVPPGKES